MTITDTLISRPTAPSVTASLVTPEERAARLLEAGTAWNTRIAADTKNAHLTYKVTGEGEGAVASIIRAGKHSFLVDEPGALAGDDLGASPVEFALGALISCQIVVYRLYANALGIQVDDIDITAEGDLDARRLFGIDETVRAGFTEVRLDIQLTGPESEERYQQLRDAVDAHCPVLDLFANATPVKVSVSKV
ncbi:MAG: OsmC family protein [Actinomycetota bacterium]|nr:OsmC family protein [Actinomycetota bacterium]